MTNIIVAITAEVARLAFAKHLLLGHEDGSYTLGDVVHYWRTHEDTSWEIECIPQTPRVLRDLLDMSDEIERDIKALVATHVHTTPDKYGQCTECNEYLDTV